MRDIDLLPDDDPRYKFYLFPINFAVSEGERPAYHEKLGAAWRIISPAFVKRLRSSGPLIEPTTVDYGVLESWYFKAYMDAADEVSTGIYSDANHHFADVGRRRGYKPRPEFGRPSPPQEPLISAGKWATQSSTSPLWSLRNTPETDALGALDGDFDKDYGFHSDAEDDPWWRLDLGDEFDVHEVRIYNRRGEPAIEGRLRRLVIETSVDAEHWTVSKDGLAEIGHQTRIGPICWRPDPPLHTRHLRLRLKGWGILHLVQVEVFGAAR
jgi:hypothetical protein